MLSALPLGIDHLLHPQQGESVRLEFKATWSEPAQIQILHSICAFANDFHEVHGGYIVLGVEEQTRIEDGKEKPTGLPLLPPKGLPPQEIDKIQGWLRGKCHELLTQPYQPILSPEVYDGKSLLVIWAPTSEQRPHQTVEWLPGGPKGPPPRWYYIRDGRDTVRAQGVTLDRLMQQTARVPFDDRRCLDAPVSVLRSSLVREYLRDVGSSLIEEKDDPTVFRSLRLVRPINSHEAPRNVAVLFFTDQPEQIFPTARIEVAQFRTPDGGDRIEERIFRGPLHRQVRDCLGYLRNLLIEEIRKHDDRAETTGWVSYPFAAIEETIVNAVYHRSYENVEGIDPIKVFLYPDRMEVTSYPGPMPGLESEHFLPGANRPRLPARNRRIGEFLKDLRLCEGRYTGIAKVYGAMQQNGSPPPQFLFGSDRSYFTVVLPAHPGYVALSALRDSTYLEATGDGVAAERRLAEAFQQHPQSGALAARLIDLYGQRFATEKAREVLEKHQSATGGHSEPQVLRAMIHIYVDSGQDVAARELLDRLPTAKGFDDQIERAIFLRRLRNEQEAHELFQQLGQPVLGDVRALLEFAQCKLALARAIRPRTSHDALARQRLWKDAAGLLQRVLQLDTSPPRHAWAWLELGRVRRRLREPVSKIEEAFKKAEELGVGDPKLRELLAQERAGMSQPPRRS